MKKVLVIGGGPAGCSAVHQLHGVGGWDITLVEAGPHLGAGVRTRYYGGHPYTFGPRHFLTQNEEVYAYLDSIVPLRDCGDHQFITYVEPDNTFYHFPIHMDDVRRMPDADVILDEIQNAYGVAESKNFEEYWINSVGQTLYNKMINSYNKKMWRVEDNSVIDTFNWSPKGVTLKEGPKAAWDTAMSAYPYAADGYNRYFDLAMDKATILLNTRIKSFDIGSKRVSFNNEMHEFDVVVNTISPDILFDYCYGELAYIGRDFHRIVFPTEHVFPEHVYFLYYANDEQFTRLVEYKQFTQHQSPTSLIGMEIPSMNGKHYPMPIKSEMEVAQKYFDLMPEGVYSMGRAGSYRYLVDIDDCIEQAMELVRVLHSGGGSDHPVLLSRWRTQE